MNAINSRRVTIEQITAMNIAGLQDADGQDIVVIDFGELESPTVTIVFEAKEAIKFANLIILQAKNI